MVQFVKHVECEIEEIHELEKEIIAIENKLYPLLRRVKGEIRYLEREYGIIIELKRLFD